jgi:hypothetical protein
VIEVALLARAAEQLHEVDGMRDDSVSRHIQSIQELSGPAEDLLVEWLESGVVPDFTYCDLSIEDLTRSPGAHPIVAILIMSKLLQDRDYYAPVIVFEDDRLQVFDRDAHTELPSPVLSDATIEFGEFVAEQIESLADGPAATLPPSAARLRYEVLAVVRTVTVPELRDQMEHYAAQVNAAATLGPLGDAGRPTDLGRVVELLRTVEKLALDDLQSLSDR